MDSDTGLPPVRVHIFVDFWNFSLAFKEIEQGFLPDWKALPHAIIRETIAVVAPENRAIYQGMNVYGSYDDRGERDASLRRWATTVLDRFPGIKVSFVPRQKKRTGPRCPTCFAVVDVCTACGSDMRGMEEKGVDTRIVTDMISLAWEGAYDVAVLVSADRDFVPVVEFLQTKGIKVVHAAFPPKGAVLSQKCWAMIDLPAIREQFRRASAPMPARAKFDAVMARVGKEPPRDGDELP